MRLKREKEREREREGMREERREIREEEKMRQIKYAQHSFPSNRRQETLFFLHFILFYPSPSLSLSLSLF
jgi:hypothetical protein